MKQLKNTLLLVSIQSRTLTYLLWNDKERRLEKEFLENPGIPEELNRILANAKEKKQETGKDVIRCRFTRSKHKAPFIKC